MMPAHLGVKCAGSIAYRLFTFIVLAISAEVQGEFASTSKDFFSLLAQPDVLTIYLKNDIELDVKDAPLEPLNLTRSITVAPSAQAPYLAGLAANYISNKIRLRPNVTITFERIILSGILRGTGQHLDLLSKSDGGAVVYTHTINHRAACLPFDKFYAKLSSLPPPSEAAGMAGFSLGSPRNFSVRAEPLCWLMSRDQGECMAPYLDMITYGTYNEITDVLIPGNGGYNSFFVTSYGVCDRPVSNECLQTRGADLCLAAALTAQAASGGGGNGSNNVGLAIGLGVGLGGALLLSVLLVAFIANTHWRQRKGVRQASGGVLDASKHSMAGQRDGTGASADGLTGGLADLEKGRDGTALLGAPTTTVESGSGGRAPAGSAGRRMEGVGGSSGRRQGGKGELDQPRLAGSTGGSGSSSSSSGVTIEASSITVVARNGDGVSSTGLGEVEVARLNLMANAAKGRAGKSAPLDVKVLQLLGQGSFGKVYKGIWHGTLVALKAQVLPPSLSGDARRRHMAVMEAAISSAINHPAIVQTYCYSFRAIKDTVGRAVIKPPKSLLPNDEPGGGGDPASQGEDGAGGEAEDQPTEVDEDYGHELLLVLEYCDGGSLRDALDKGVLHHGRPWPWDWRRTIQAAGAGADGTAAALCGAVLGNAGARPPNYALRQLQQAALTAEGGNEGAAGALLAAVSGGAAAAQAAAAPASGTGGAGGLQPPAKTPDSNKQLSAADTGSSAATDAHPAGTPAAADGGGKGRTANAAGPPALGPDGTAAAARRAAARPSGAVATDARSSASRTVHATDMPTDFWPTLATYEPDFTHGAFEVVVPDAQGKDGRKDGPAAAGAAAEAAARPAASAGAQAAAVVARDRAPATLREDIAGPGGGGGVSNINAAVAQVLAGAPTAASSLVSSFSAVSAGDNAAAAAAADRLAMMYLLQQAAAAVAMAGPPGAVGGYAKLLADFVSASNLSGLGSLSGLATSDAAAALLNSLGASGMAADIAGGGGAAAGFDERSSVETIISPPDEVLAAVGAGRLIPTGAGGGDAGIAAGGEGCGSSSAAPAGSLGSTGNGKMAGNGVAESGEDSGRPQPAIRYGLMLALAADVASGLMHLHAHGVVHGDVKASNVLLKQIVVSDSWEAAGRALDATRSNTGAAGAGTGVSSIVEPETGPDSQPPHAVASPLRQIQQQHQQQLMHQHGSSLPSLGSGVESSRVERGPLLGLCAKVSDFGLSTMLSASNTDTHISATTAAGSLSHMSPELLLCGHVSKANDVYAYGILLFELFTGERAWEGMPRALLPARVALEGWRPVFPPHTPAGYRHLAERCWQADPAKRPNFEEIVSDIKTLREHALASDLQDWMPVVNPQLAFLQQLMQQRRPLQGPPVGGPASYGPTSVPCGPAVGGGLAPNPLDEDPPRWAATGPGGQLGVRPKAAVPRAAVSRH